MMQEDMSGQYNTQLTPEEEAAYVLWARGLGKEADVYDYDLRGAFKAQVKGGANGHFPDTFKKPNHPTFSVESIYDDPKAPTGGRWQEMHGRTVFSASPRNLANMPNGQLQDYFRRYEPDVHLVLPK